MELEHRANLDSLGPKTLGLGLDVGDVNRRYAGLFLWLALRDRNLALLTKPFELADLLDYLEYVLTDSPQQPAFLQ